VQNSKRKTTTQSPLNIDVINQTRINQRQLQISHIKKTARQLNVIFDYPTNQPIEIILATPGQIKTINREHRGKNEATDVLSFPQHFHDKFPQNILGTIILCPTVIKKQEGAYDLIPYLIHGYLHLMGYDHMSKSEQKEWDKIQKWVLKLIG